MAMLMLCDNASVSDAAEPVLIEKARLLAASALS